MLSYTWPPSSQITYRIPLNRRRQAREQAGRMTTGGESTSSIAIASDGDNNDYDDWSAGWMSTWGPTYLPRQTQCRIDQDQGDDDDDY